MLVFDQPSPLIAGVVLVQTDFGVSEAVLGHVLHDSLFGLRRNVVVVDAAVPQQHLAWNSDHPADSVEDRELFAPLDHDLVGSAWIVRDLLAFKDRTSGHCKPQQGSAHQL